MSYNVSGFTIKKLDSLTLPYAKVLEMTEGALTDKDGVLTFDNFYAESMKLTGAREGDRLHVSDLHYSGEGSGTYWDTFEGLLKLSTGELRVLMVWEGGDTVEMLTVKEGDVLQEQL